MKLNIDCIRDVMLDIESLGFNETTYPDALHEALPAYGLDEITYACLRLLEADYLHGETILMPGQVEPDFKSVGPLTFQGHQFLENIRVKTNWEKTKQVIAEIGSRSLPIISEVAKGVVSAAATAYFQGL